MEVTRVSRPATVRDHLSSRSKGNEKVGDRENTNGEREVMKKGQKHQPELHLLIQITPPCVASPTDPEAITDCLVTVPAEVVIEVPRKLGRYLPTEIGAIRH